MDGHKQFMLADMFTSVYKHLWILIVIDPLCEDFK